MTTPSPGPILGPCEAWIDGAYVAERCPNAGIGTNTSLLELVAIEASMALYEISGRLFTGSCEATVRPCRTGCGCFGEGSGLGGIWGWTDSAGGYWQNDCGDRCGCQPLSQVKLAGYPVTSITEVKIDGVVLPEIDAAGDPNYRLDGWRYLVRMSSPGPPVLARSWPACQDLSLSDAEPGTFSVRYRYGVQPPQLGRDAAADLACQLWLSSSGAECSLPSGVTKITRQGITIDRGLLVNWFDKASATGVVSLDLFLRSYWKTRSSRRPAVWSPDLPAYPRG